MGQRLRDGVEFDPLGFAGWLDAQPDIGPKWRPRYVRVIAEPPTTGTFKIVKRTLVHEKWRGDRVRGDPVFVRDRDEPAYRPFTVVDESELHASFVRYDRERFWGL